MESEARWRTEKKGKLRKTEVNHLTSCTSQQSQDQFLKVKQDLSLHHNFIPQSKSVSLTTYAGDMNVPFLKR